ncbi:hypothetical protein [Selenomonas sp. FOBRC9]
MTNDFIELLSCKGHYE